MIHRTHCKKHFSVLILIGCLATFLVGCNDSKENLSIAKPKYTPHVNVFIGTDGEGNTHPGAVMPWGMVAFSPQTFDFTKMQLPTGYRHGQDTIYGFSCVNFSGVGCPATGSVPFKFSTRPFGESYKGSSYSQEVASPGFYSVKLDEENIEVKVTATTRSGLFELSIPKGKSYVYLDLTAQQGHIKGGKVESHTASSVNGYQLEGFFCGSNNRSHTYFNVELSEASDSTYLVYKNKNTNDFQQSLDAEPSGIVYRFTNNEPGKIYIKVGVSFVSIANAIENINSEQSAFDFERVRNQAEAAWESELGKIEISETTDDDRSVFYSALYHSLLMPMTFSDVNGEYIKQGSKGEIAIAKGYTQYTAFSLWDTYRTTHPLFTLVYPERQLDMVKSMTAMYEQSGWMPKWEIFGYEPNIMVGDPAAIVIGDSYVKGIRNFDVNKAYEGLTKQADQIIGNRMRPGLKEYLSLGYISMDGEFSDAKKFDWNNGIVWGTVSTTMEFNLADYNISQMANVLGKDDDYKRYLDRSMSFLHLYDKETGLIRPKNKDGSWYEPFDASQGLWDVMKFGLRGGPGFVEGNAWQYLYSVPHGLDSLKSVMGEALFLSQLDTIFEKQYFDMTNEPDLGFPFFYNYTSERNYRTAQAVHGLLAKHFTNDESGLPGNDDAGTLSAWVIFAKMGIYPDTPGKPSYMITVPSYKRIKIKLNPKFYKANEFVIERNGSMEGSIQSIKLNGEDIEYRINHLDFTAANSTLVITTDKPLADNKID